MKAVSIVEPGRVEIVELPKPRLGPEDVLIEIHYVGLCGSDLNTYRGHFSLVAYPLIPGHEIGGVIAAKGSAVPDALCLGAQVTVSPYTACGVCPACRIGRTNCCQYNQTLGVQRNGALCETFALPYHKVYPTTSLAPQDLALAEPMSVGYHAANRGQVTEMDTVLAIGCGTIGIGVVAAAARKGATVIVVDIDDAKLELARRFGAHHTINSMAQDPLARVLEMTNGEGVNVTIEAVGLSDTYRLAIEATAYAGRVVYVGYADETVCYDTTDFVRKELDIRGARNALRELPAVIRMIEDDPEAFRQLVTRMYPLGQAPQAFRDWDASPGNVTKLLIDVRG
jgi:threonine dehydrogenase-like Zn-dependent dehydrogenase